MSVKPVSVAASLGGADTLRDQGKKPANFNRFLSLRDRSRSASGGRSVSPAVKRRADGDPDLVRGKSPRLDGNVVFIAMEAVEKKIQKGRQGMTTMKDFLSKADNNVDAAMSEFLGGLVDALDGVFDTLVDISSAIVDNAATKSPGKEKGKTSARMVQQHPVGAAPAASEAATTPPPEDEGKKKFVSAVREAEKSVLVFNLDLGKVPIMNTGTIAKKVTESITAKAAAAEGSDNVRPSEDTIMILEDTLSVMKGMEFFGKVTKVYNNTKNNGDELNGKFCTLPVKMVFKDKDSKARAEAVLRKTCKLQCTTPYPPLLRKLIKETIDSYRGKFPDSFIQVKVDAEGGKLLLSRRSKEDNKWTNNFEVIPISAGAMSLGRVGNTGANGDTVMTDVSSL